MKKNSVSPSLSFVLWKMIEKKKKKRKTKIEKRKRQFFIPNIRVEEERRGRELTAILGFVNCD